MTNTDSKDAPTDTELDRQIDTLIDGVCAGFARTLQNMGVIGKLRDMDKVSPLNPDEAKAQLKQLIARERLDEARLWDKRILGSPRKVTSNDRAKARIAALQAQADKEQG